MSAPSLARLLSRAKQRMGVIQSRHLDKLDVTEPQAAVIMALKRCGENEIVTQRALTAKTGIDRSTMCELIDRMKDKGLLTTSVPDDNKRANEIILTVKGRRVADNLSRKMTAAERDLLGLLLPAQRVVFVTALQAIDRADGP